MLSYSAALWSDKQEATLPLSGIVFLCEENVVPGGKERRLHEISLQENKATSFLNNWKTKTRLLAFLNDVLEKKQKRPGWFFANWSQITASILRALHSSPWSSIHPQPGWGQNLPTVSHGTAGRLRGLGGICAFPSVAHSLLSKPLPLSAAICFQPYPTGRKHEHFHRIRTMHKLKKKKKIERRAYGKFNCLLSQPENKTW